MSLRQPNMVIAGLSLLVTAPFCFHSRLCQSVFAVLSELGNQVASLNKCLITVLALVRLFSTMCPEMVCYLFEAF